MVRAVNGVTLSSTAVRTLGLVGESGSGKTVTALTILGLTRSQIPRSQARCCSTESISCPAGSATSSHSRAPRGDGLPGSAVVPAPDVQSRLADRRGDPAHEKVAQAAARARTVDLLRIVGIPSPEERVDAYPHELSGGMRQRVMIAMALALGPDLLIADEPTSALDVTVQSQILELLAELQRETGMALLLVSHDFGVIAENADEVAVMYAGRMVEHGTAIEVIGAPIHPYTRGLLASIPHVDGPRSDQLTPIPGAPPGGVTPAVRAAPFIRDARTLARPAACACRRSSGRRGSPLRVRSWPHGSHRAGAHEPADTRPRAAVLMLCETSSSTSLRAARSASSGIRRPCRRRSLVRDRARRDARARRRDGLREVDGRPARDAAPRADQRDASSTKARTSRTGPGGRLKPVRREIQIVFQDPYSSLNPRRRVGSIVGDPLRVTRHRIAIRASAHASRRCWAASGSIRRTATATRTSSPAGSDSESASRARSSRARGSS